MSTNGAGRAARAASSFPFALASVSTDRGHIHAAANRLRHFGDGPRDPQNIFRRIVVHLAVRFDVIAKLNDARLFGREDRAHFVQRPGEIIAVVVERLVGVLARVETAARLIRKHGIRPIDDAFGDFAKKRLARDLVAVQKILQQLRIVVRHFLEMRHAPALVHRIAMESAGQLVVDASRAHFLQRERGNFQHPRAAARLVAFEQQIERRGMRKFRRAAKSSVARIK